MPSETRVAVPSGWTSTMRATRFATGAGQVSASSSSGWPRSTTSSASGAVSKVSEPASSGRWSPAISASGLRVNHSPEAVPVSSGEWTIASPAPAPGAVGEPAGGVDGEGAGGRRGPRVHGDPVAGIVGAPRRRARAVEDVGAHLRHGVGAVRLVAQPAVPPADRLGVEVPARLRPGEVRVLVDPRADHRLHARPDARRCLERRVAVAVGPAGDDQRRHVEAGEVLADRAVAPEARRGAGATATPRAGTARLRAAPATLPASGRRRSPGRAAATGRRASSRPRTAAPTGGSRSCSGCRRCSGRRSRRSR